MKNNKLILKLLVIIFLFLFLALHILKDIFHDFSYMLYSVVIPIMWIVLGSIYSDKTAKNINLIIFSLYVFFLYSYTRSIEPILSKDSLLAITLLFLIASPFFTLLFAFNKRLSKYLIITSMCLILSLSLIFTLVYRTTGAITKDVIYAVLQSNETELISFIYDATFTINNFILISLLFIISLFIFSFRNNIIETIDAKLKFLIILFFLSLTLITYSNSAFYGIKTILKNYNSYHIEIDLIKKRVEKTKAERKARILEDKAKVQEKRGSSLIPSKQVEQKVKRGELHVLIIGESVAKYNLSSYDYLNKTTPWLHSSNTKIKFENVHSNHTHTNKSLSMALTASNQYNNKKYYSSPSLISELNLAGYTTAWISNQIQAGQWDNLVSVIADESDYVNFINSNIGKTTATSYLDEKLVHELNSYLSTLDMENNNFIVLHMMGSHSSYCNRIKGVNISLSKLPNQYYAQKDNLCYDKSIKYTDIQLKHIHNLLSQKTNFSSMTFIPDHGEDVFNRIGHNSAKFTEYMAQIPMFVWLGENISASISHNLKNNKAKSFTNDLLFETMLGITGVNSSSNENKYNLASADFEDLSNKATTLHGKKKISHFPTNISKKNVANNEKFMAHRVNTIGSLNDAYKQGFQRIEFDLYYHKKSNTIFMGHGNKALTGGTLEEFLIIENNKFKQLWFDFKNINLDNINEIKTRLVFLDKKYNLKARSLIESGMTSNEFSALSSEGWYTSYYLPTGKILDLIKKDNIIESQQYTEILLHQLNAQAIKSISFDYRLYPYVQQYLIKSKLLPKHTKLNTWLRLSSADKDFSSKINKNENMVVNNPLIDNIIIQFPSRFKI